MDFALYEKFKNESDRRVRYFADLQPGAHVHLSAICGTGMGSVAGLLKQLGFFVSGSDKRFYPPMGDVVRKIADKLYEGYSGENLAKRPDLVVIGNNLSKDNPEVQAILNSDIPYASMSETLRALLIGEKDFCGNSIVVAGTHGKTTTTAAIATLLDHAGRKPGFFIGGVPLDLPSSVRAPDSTRPAVDRMSVLEGDEYDSAYFAKWPKFLSYRPDILIITSIEFDHADIYENLTEIEREFSRLVEMVPADGIIFVSDQGESLIRLVPEWRKKVSCKLITYGTTELAEIKILDRKILSEASGQLLKLQLQSGQVEIRSKLGGLQNGYNCLVAAAAGERLGLSTAELSKGLASFTGVLRRQTEYKTVNGALLIEDFAHHPSAVKVTLDGIREQFPGKRIIAAFEPRSNTSMRAFFQSDYEKSFKGADIALILEITQKNVYSATSSESALLDVNRLVSGIKMTGPEAKSFQTIAELEEWLLLNVKGGDVVVCMSNGDFGGLIERLKSAAQN